MVESGVAKPDQFELPDGTRISILHEDRGVIAIDKPAGWMLGPDDAEHHERNLHRALVEEIEEGAWWATSRNLKFLRFVHRLDAPTTGVLLLSKSQGAMAAFSRVFAERSVKKAYLAVTDVVPKEKSWVCREPLGPDPLEHGKHRVDYPAGKEAETHFEVLQAREHRALVLARPVTGRTHQIRLHLAHSGCPVTGDILYGRRDMFGLALRAIRLEYPDPFLKRQTVIVAPVVDFCLRHGFDPASVPPEVLARFIRRPAAKEAPKVADSKDPVGSAGNPQVKAPTRPAQADGMAKHSPKGGGGQRRADRPGGFRPPSPQK
jgi:23S rRNA pseudouridine1911/1915/1917 synthase